MAVQQRRKVVWFLVLLDVAILFAFVFVATAGQGDLDLPLLPPDDPRRVVRTPAALPTPPEARASFAPQGGGGLYFFGEFVQELGRVVYVLDYSQSMGPDRWAALRREFSRSVRNFDGEFAALLYGCSVSPFADDYSTDSEAAVSWVESRPRPWLGHNATGTAQAVLYAFSLQPDAVVLLTDGAPGGCGLARPGQVPYVAHAKVIRDHNVDQVPVHTFVFPNDEYAVRFGRIVAGDSGGTAFVVR